MTSWPDLPEQVGRILHLIDDGEVTGYGEIARALGMPRGARAVARALASGDHGWDLAAPVVPVSRTRGRAGHKRFIVPDMGEGDNSRSAALARRAVPFTRDGDDLLIPTHLCLDAEELSERLDGGSCHLR